MSPGLAPIVGHEGHHLDAGRRSGGWVGWSAVRLAACLVVVGCGGNGGEADAERVASSTTGPVMTTTTTMAAPSTTPAPSSTTATTAASPEVVLGPDGLGVVVFGDPADAVVTRLGELLGPPLDDRALGSCPTGEADRLVQFAELAVVLAGQGADQRFVAWDVGLASGGVPALRTAEGIGVGSTVAELRAAYPGGLEIVPDDAFGPRFEVRRPSGVISGTLSGTGPGDTVVTLGAGEASCGR